jgi:hypothetical protein
MCNSCCWCEKSACRQLYCIYCFSFVVQTYEGAALDSAQYISCPFPDAEVVSQNPSKSEAVRNLSWRVKFQCCIGVWFCTTPRTQDLTATVWHLFNVQVCIGRVELTATNSLHAQDVVLGYINCFIDIQRGLGDSTLISAVFCFDGRTTSVRCWRFVRSVSLYCAHTHFLEPTVTE